MQFISYTYKNESKRFFFKQTLIHHLWTIYTIYRAKQYKIIGLLRYYFGYRLNCELRKKLVIIFSKLFFIVFQCFLIYKKTNNPGNDLKRDSFNVCRKYTSSLHNMFLCANSSFFLYILCDKRPWRKHALTKKLHCLSSVLGLW